MDQSDHLHHRRWTTPGTPMTDELLADTVTTFLDAGFYRVKVLFRFKVVAENYIVKGYPRKTRWCVLSSDSRLQTHLLFKTLKEAKSYCLQFAASE